MIDISDYIEVRECYYKGETYSVRDNGAVLRHSQEGKPIRKYDNRWTFGKPNNHGYLLIVAELVHRIVAFGFLGESPSKQHVVDHIDTNRQNNRPDNLRWVTKVENLLLNPITAKRIETCCNCSIEDFLKTPNKYHILLKRGHSSISWMRTVSKQESLHCLENLTKWAQLDGHYNGGTIGEWIFNRNLQTRSEEIDKAFISIEKTTGISRSSLCQKKFKKGTHYEARKFAAKQLHKILNLTDAEIGYILGLSSESVRVYKEVSSDCFSKDYKEQTYKYSVRLSSESITIPANVIQINWATESKFPCCPASASQTPLKDYSKQLELGEILFHNIFYSTRILKYEVIERDKCLVVLYSVVREANSLIRWGIMKITHDSKHFIHEIIYNYNRTLEHYNEIDAMNHFECLIDGKNWIPLFDSQGKEFREGYMPL